MALIEMGSVEEAVGALVVSETDHVSAQNRLDS